MSEKFGRLFGGISACLILANAVATPVMAEEKKVTQNAGIDNTRMGMHRALAQLSFEAFQQGNLDRAAEFARILERTWDAAEEGGGPRSLEVKSKDLFEVLDKSMDNFIKPVLHYDTKAPDAAAVKVAYEDFLRKLKQGDESPK
jgi:hypothetical protein